MSNDLLASAMKCGTRSHPVLFPELQLLTLKTTYILPVSVLIG